MTPRYKVTLTEEERGQLEALTRSGQTAAPKFVHARALLLCDAGPHGSPWKVADIAEALGVTSRTIEHLKERFVEEGIEAALVRKPRAKGQALWNLEPLRWLLRCRALSGKAERKMNKFRACQDRILWLTL